MGILGDMADANNENELLLDSGKTEKQSQIVTAEDGHTYHKSKSANASEAPTNTGTLEKLKHQAEAAVAGLTPYEADFIMACTMHYNIHGKMLDMETAFVKYKVEPDTYSTLLSTPVVAHRLRAAEILPPEEVESPLIAKSSVLTFEQMRAANVMLDLLDTRSDKKKLQDLGVSTLKYQNWLRQPAFRDYLAERAESLIQASHHEAMLALADKVRQGDLKGIQFYLEYTGKYVQASRQIAAGGSAPVLGDVQLLIAHLIEIIMEEVTDPIVAVKISERIKGITQARQMANDLTDTIVVPQALPMRDDTELLGQIKENFDEAAASNGRAQGNAVN